MGHLATVASVREGNETTAGAGKPIERLLAGTPIPCGLAGCSDLGVLAKERHTARISGGDGSGHRFTRGAGEGAGGGPCRPGPVGTRVGGYRRIRWKKPRWSSALLRKHAVFHMSGKYRSVLGPSVRCLGIVGCKFKTHLRDDIRGG
jgi:hypothetical protein